MGVQANLRAIGNLEGDTAAHSHSAINLNPPAIFALTAIAAATVYFFRLGSAPLGASETYSAWAAALPSASSIVRIPILLDPGKQVFYYILLHYFTGVFGLGETSLRMLSTISAMATLVILFTVGRAMFTDEVAASACVLWAFNPVLMILARRARMYPMLAAIALTHFMLLWQVRRRPEWPRTILCGIFGALTIYTHLAGLFLIGAEAAMLTRDLYRGRRGKMPWIALAIALLLFAPYFPVLQGQSRALVYGHWLDWISTGYHFNLAEKVLVAIGAGAVGLAIVFGSAKEQDPEEPLRWCLAWGLLPLITILAGSVIVRPMFHIRYLIPCVAMIALMLARVLEGFGSKIRNLAVVAITTILLILVPIKEITHEPWRDISALITAQSVSNQSGSSRSASNQSRPPQPVFFEAGFLFFGKSEGVANGGFPNGYYRIPFDYYFRAANPKLAVPGWDPSQAKKIISDEIARAGGGWLVSWKEESNARAELPDPASFRITKQVSHHLIALYRIDPAPSPSH